MKPVIYITRKIPDDILQPYQDSFDFRMWDKEETPVPRDVLLSEAASADGVLCLLTEAIDKEFLAAAKHLKIVANMAVGYDNIDVEAAREHGVVVTNTPDVLTETTADLAFALLMATARRIVEANDYIRDDKWEYWSPYLLAGSDIHGKKIGIVGMGRIGEAVARRAKGFDMSILYHNRSRKVKAEQELGAVYCEFTELMKEADFVVSLIPLTEETKEMFNEQAFQNMKSSAVFINVSRGATVDEQALHDALTANTIRAAGLDVFNQEPISAEHPLMKLDNVVCLPHIGSASVATRTKMLELCLDNLKEVLNGAQAMTPVN
ncbi:D-glycerate dehydrogenase [Lentibacillus sp. CBA3610]|uniref:2-hydroxyacid dehydrogenase n=1 Tax=Lentibacillus sp. CBA3610 TaxID=2518176 RepID=UPI00159541C3|nr:D-glycerate dehydrogenase [Lentibacillus sp. CBA3610]QKY69786.1 D-glycerate dehydrogenase [Lentibacillus sp. CBA3610]